MKFLELSKSKQNDLNSRFVINKPSETLIDKYGRPYIQNNGKMMCTLKTWYK